MINFLNLVLHAAPNHCPLSRRLSRRCYFRRGRFWRRAPVVARARCCCRSRAGSPLIDRRSINWQPLPAGFGFAHIRWKPVAIFLFGAIPAAVLGALSFVQISKTLVTRGIGLAIILFVLLKLTGILQLKPGKILLVIGGSIVGFLSGLVGSAGPIGAAIFLTLGLSPVSYIASEATTALVMHGVKMIIYQQFITLDKQFWLLAVLLGGAMVLGTWTANKYIEKITPENFQKFVSVLLIMIGLVMLVRGG